MGADLSIKIGPYIKVKGKKTKTVTKIKRECPNHKRANNEKNKFCFECGSEVKNVEYQREISVLPLSVLSKYEDRVFIPEGMENIVVPNINAPGHIKFDPEYGSDFVNLLDKKDIIEKQTNWVEEEYSKEIQSLKDEFGESNVEICWGVLGYWF